MSLSMEGGSSEVFRGLKLVKVARMVRLLRLFRVLKIARLQVLAEEFMEVRWRCRMRGRGGGESVVPTVDWFTEERIYVGFTTREGTWERSGD